VLGQISKIIFVLDLESVKGKIRKCLSILLRLILVDNGILQDHILSDFQL